MADMHVLGWALYHGTLVTGVKCTKDNVPICEYIIQLNFVHCFPYQAYSINKYRTCSIIRPLE